METVLGDLKDYNPITSQTVLCLTLDLVPTGGVFGKYGAAGCDDLLRDTLYTWAYDAIINGKAGAIGFVEIMASVVKQLEYDFPGAFIEKGKSTQNPIP